MWKSFIILEHMCSTGVEVNIAHRVTENEWWQLDIRGCRVHITAD